MVVVVCVVESGALQAMAENSIDNAKREMIIFFSIGGSFLNVRHAEGGVFYLAGDFAESGKMIFINLLVASTAVSGSSMGAIMWSR